MIIIFVKNQDEVISWLPSPGLSPWPKIAYPIALKIKIILKKNCWHLQLSTDTKFLNFFAVFDILLKSTNISVNLKLMTEIFFLTEFLIVIWNYFVRSFQMRCYMTILKKNIILTVRPIEVEADQFCCFIFYSKAINQHIIWKLFFF